MYASINLVIIGSHNGLVACSLPSYYLNQYWLMMNGLYEQCNLNKIIIISFPNALKCNLHDDCRFVSASMWLTYSAEVHQVRPHRVVDNGRSARHHVVGKLDAETNQPCDDVTPVKKRSPIHGKTKMGRCLTSPIPMSSIAPINGIFHIRRHYCERQFWHGLKRYWKEHKTANVKHKLMSRYM